jgi:hypothetical protein
MYKDQCQLKPLLIAAVIFSPFLSLQFISETMRHVFSCVSSTLILLLAGNAYSQMGRSEDRAAAENPILVITTDIGGDPDDQQSLTRLLVYSNEFDIRGLIASASGTRGELGMDTVKDCLIRDYVVAYGKVYDHLRMHAPGYPHPDTLMARIKKGNPQRGPEHIGKGNDTEGSEWIIRVVDGSGDRRVNVGIWGGQTDLVQALWKVKHTRNPEEYAWFTGKLTVYDINDQDGLYGYIREEFPELFYILAKAPEGADKREGAYRGMYLGGAEELTSREWIDRHVRNGHGPLGALYPPETWTAPNPYGAMKEGDTPSWFYFLRNGLQDPGQPGWGGWGGRFKPVSGNFYRDDEDFADTVIDARSTVSRWRPAFQNDFEARMEWCIKSFDETNHKPVAAVMGDDTDAILHVDAREGDTLRFSALGSYDPDGGSLDFAWWTYPEAGSNLQCPALMDYTTPEVSFMVPYGEAGADLHLILEVSDNGAPSLRDYRRIVINIY